MCLLLHSLKVLQFLFLLRFYLFNFLFQLLPWQILLFYKIKYEHLINTSTVRKRKYTIGKAKKKKKLFLLQSKSGENAEIKFPPFSLTMNIGQRSSNAEGWNKQFDSFALSVSKWDSNS